MTKATLETHDQTVSIAIQKDDLNIDDLWDLLLEPLLLGAGYHSETVQKLVNPDLVIPRKE